MNARSCFATEAANLIDPLEELIRITLLRPLETDEGILPTGSQGTIMSVYDDGAAYRLEFTTPLRTLQTIACGALSAIPGSHDGSRLGVADEVPNRA